MVSAFLPIDYNDERLITFKSTNVMRKATAILKKKGVRP